jgi:hypothetical protein
VAVLPIAMSLTIRAENHGWRPEVMDGVLTEFLDAVGDKTAV